MLLQGENLHPSVEAVQRKLRSEVLRRFITEEREGHQEDLLIATILDPRFKHFMFPGATLQMRTDAERYLKAAYDANWSPEARSISEQMETLEPNLVGCSSHPNITQYDLL